MKNAKLAHFFILVFSTIFISAKPAPELGVTCNDGSITHHTEFVTTENPVNTVTRTGSFVANMPMTYAISGDVTLSNVNGIITVVFENNFSTVQGITLEVFLTKTKTLNLSTDVLISTAPLDQGTSLGTPIAGSQSFMVPAGVDAYEFDNVIVQCTSAAILWGHANLCKSELNLTGTDLPSDNYRSAQTILSTATFASSGEIIFETSEAILLDAGFYVPASTSFQTLVGSGYGCLQEN